MISRFVLLIVVLLSSPDALFGEVDATKQKAFNAAIQRRRVPLSSRLVGAEISLLLEHPTSLKDRTFLPL